MEIESILLILAVLILVVFYISQPFNRRSFSVSAEEKSLSSLLAERDRILDALLELDFDHDLGKIPAENYPDQRANLVQRGAEILRKLDNLPSGASSTGDDAQLDAIIAARRSEKDTGEEFDYLEEVIAERKDQGKAKAGKFCFNCGKAIKITDKFCFHCGTDLT
ncbi:MAG: zinc ribbon domain-containing protein [Chloroflexi bacterium]|nr:zinc ribbon domain-containing protein [Chloroflexota bacterium]